MKQGGSTSRLLERARKYATQVGWDTDEGERKARDFLISLENPGSPNNWRPRFAGMKQRAYLHVNFPVDELQSTVLNDTHPRKVCVWGRRRGKTTVALLWLFQRALSKPGSTNWYVAPTYRQAKRTVWRMAKNLYSKSVLCRRPNETELTFEFRNGSIISLLGAEDPDALRGPGLWSVVLDEYGTMREDAWTVGIQPALSDTQGHALFIGTPNALRGPHFRAMWEKLAKGELFPHWIGWFSSTMDAKHVSKDEIELARKTMRPHEFRQEYEASFENLAGRVWPEFSELLYAQGGHVVPMQPNETYKTLPEGWEVVAGIDWGWKHPTVCTFLGVGGAGQAIVLAEYVASYSRLSDHVRGLADIARYYGGIGNVQFFADPSRPEYIDEMQNVFHIPVVKATNAREVGVDRVGRMFARRALLVAACCPNTIAGVLRYGYDPSSTAPKIMKKDDDEADALRYAVMGAYPPDESAASGLLGVTEDWEQDPIWSENWLKSRWEDQWAGPRRR